MTAIITTLPGRWFASLGTDNTIGLFTDRGYEVPSAQERRALRRILTGGDNDAA